MRNEIIVKVDTEGMVEKLLEWSSAGIPPLNMGGRVEQKPAVGRIVHYHHEGNELPQAAIVTYVFQNPADGMCTLQVFNSTNYEKSGVPFSDTPKPGHWSWPPRG